ncbi:hypothetical protein EON65_39505, partial [archaeon]
MMFFETFQTIKPKPLTNPAYKSGVIKEEPDKQSFWDKLIELDEESDLLSFSEETKSENRAQAIKPRLPSTKYKIVKLDDVPLAHSIYPGLHIDSSINLFPFLTQPRSPAQTQYIFDPNSIRLDISTRYFIGGLRAREDIIWVNAGVEDELKHCYQQWYQCLHDSVNRLVESDLDCFYILGSSYYELNVDDNYILPTYCFYREAPKGAGEEQVQVLILHCGQYVIKRLLSMGIPCKRLLESEQKAVLSHSTSTQGRSMHLFGSNHILVEGQVGVRAAAHFLADEVFGLVCRYNRKSVVPSIASAAQLLH